MDELVVAQHKYISAKRAAELTGYARDYIGQLVRKGKLRAERVGRAWFVHEADLRMLAGVSEGATESVASKTLMAFGRKAQIPLTPSTIEISLPKTWSNIKYLDDPEHSSSIISDSRDSANSKDRIEMTNATSVRPEPQVLIAQDQARHASVQRMDGIRVLSRSPVRQTGRQAQRASRTVLFLFLFLLGVSAMLVLGIISST